VQPLQYVEKLGVESVLSKTPGASVMSDSNSFIVAVMLGNGLVVGLKDPDVAKAADWTKIAKKFESFAAVDGASDSVAIDFVLDPSDNLFGVTMCRNNLTNNGRMYGFTTSTSGPSTQFTPSSWANNAPYLSLQANIRFLELYHTSILITSNANGKQPVVVVPVASLLDLKGAAFASTSPDSCSADPACNSNCCLIDVSIDSDSYGTITGNAYVSGGVVGLLSHGLNAKGTAAAKYDPATGNTIWSTDSLQFIAESFQPNPVVDPYTKNVYWVGLDGLPQQNDAPYVFYCVSGTTGAVCPGFKSTQNGKGGGISLNLNAGLKPT